MSVGAVKAGEAFVEIGGRDKKLGEALARSQKKLKTFGQKVKDLGKTFAKLGAIAVGSIAVISFVKAIKAASEFEETLSKFNAVFKEQAEVTRAWAAAFSKDVGRAEDQVIGFLSTMQDTFVPLGFARDRAAELSKQIVKLAIDLASFNNESEPETIRSLQSALVGNTETVRKYGVIITQVTLGQELMALGLAESAAKATEQQKVLARLSIIMKSTTDAQGDAERTSGSFANQMKALNAAFRSLAITAGQAVLPEMTRLVSAVKVAAAKFGDWLKAGNRLREMFKTLVTAWKLASKPIIFIAKGVALAFDVISIAIADLITALTGLQQFEGQNELFFIERRRAANAQRAQEARGKELEAAKKQAGIDTKAAKVQETRLTAARKADEERIASNEALVKLGIALREIARKAEDKKRTAQKEAIRASTKASDERRAAEKAEKGKLFQRAARALSEPLPGKEKLPTGGFGAFASRLLSQQIPRALTTVGEKSLDMLTRIAATTEKMRDAFREVALRIDPELRGRRMILKGEGRFGIQELREDLSADLFGLIAGFRGKPEKLEELVAAQTAVAQKMLALAEQDLRLRLREFDEGIVGVLEG